jgi:transcriptional regulator with XRE-family HTH domain
MPTLKQRATGGDRPCCSRYWQTPSARAGRRYGARMDTRNELREFLTSRRGRIKPEEAGLRTYGSGPRRVPGLRREEVALLAGVSADYYTRLERGNSAGVSDTVLEALARALQLDGTEREHLFDLARARQASTVKRRRRARREIRPGVQRMIDAMTGVPAFVRNGRLDILGANRLGRALYSEHFDSHAQPPNTARYVFLDSRSPSFYRDWDTVAADVVAILRAEAGRDPYDRELSDLVGELSTRNELFRTLWAAHNVRTHDTGTKRVTHPLVGELDLSYEAMELVADPGLTMFVYTAEPGSRSEQALNLLASWSAAPDEETADADHEEQPRHRHRA